MLEFSSNPTSSYDKVSLYIYIFEGLLVTLVNMFLAVRLFSNHHLRGQKEYVVIGSLIIFDIIFGMTYFSAGLGRLIVVIKYEYFPLVSMFDCFLTVHNQLFIVSTIVGGLQLLLTALDRFFCIFFPLHYIKLHVEYAYFLMIIPYLFLVPLWLPGAFASYENREFKNFTMNCMLNQAITVAWYMYYKIFRATCTFLCVLIYIPVFTKIFESIHKHTRLVPCTSSKNNSRLLSMTKTVALITGSTFTLFTIPDLITSLWPFVNSNVFYLMNLNKGVVNILIFMLTQKTLRSLMFPIRSRRLSSDLYSTKKINPTILVHVI